MQLSKHFSMLEATMSATARKEKINNEPTEEVLEVMLKTAQKMEVVRELLGSKPVTITSWYRSPDLNKAVKGSPTSQHVKGEAVDFRCYHFGDARQICLFLRQHKDILNYDQLILEPTWVHISFTDVNPRRQDLTYVNGRFIPGIS